MSKSRKSLRLAAILLLFTLPLANFPNLTSAQDPPDPTDDAATISGLLTITWGDSIDGRSTAVYTVSNASGQRTTLQIDDAVSRKLGGILQFNGRQVSVRGTWATPPISSGGPAGTSAEPQVLEVETITPAVPSQSFGPPIDGTPEFAGVTGSHPWITIMCKFSDIAAEPEDFAFFEGMYSDMEPGLDHYWREVSFSNFDLDGSGVAGTGWYTLPHDDAHYNPTAASGGADLTALMTDCIAEADPDVDFSVYDGINMMFNFDFDRGWAWGGGTGTITLDGVTRSWKATWEPPWAYANISVIAHETGHGFGLPHSTAIDWAAVYDNAWDVMSWDRYNCGAGSAHRDPTYGCMAQHTISYHKDLLDVISASKMLTLLPGSSATITLDDLAAPASTGYHLAKIPIGVSANSYYTVEARRHTGYDEKLPGEAVIIHNVDVGAAVLVPNASSTDAGVRWNTGETFADAANGIAVTVNSATTTGFEVSLSNRPMSVPIDMVMVLDRSGSMLWSVPGDNPEGFATRRDALSAGVGGFLSDVLALSPPADTALGLTLFSSKALDVPSLGALSSPLDLALTTSVNGEIGPSAPAHSAAPGCDWSSTPENCEWNATSLGAALEDGLTKLGGGDPTHTKLIVLFTDGEQNTSPYVTSDGLKICAASSDPVACAAEPRIDPDVRIISVGIGDPSSSYHIVLQNLADESQFGTYISANAPTPADFPCAASITDAFQCVASYALAGNSPQMVSYSSGVLGGTPTTLDAFDVNSGVKMLLLSFSFDPAIDASVFDELSNWIEIEKDGADVTGRFDVVESLDASKHVLVKTVFPEPGDPEAEAFEPRGSYTVRLARPDGMSGDIGFRALTFVDDRSLGMAWRIREPSDPRADIAFSPSMQLTWLGVPLENASVTAQVIQPGDDVGDLLARMPDVDLDLKSKSTGVEPISVGYRKYLGLLNDSEWALKLAPTSSQQPLQYQGEGMYDISFDPGQISGVYQIRYNVEADVAGYGKIQRVAVQSVYVRPGDIDVKASILSKRVRGKTVMVQLRPITTYGKFIGPGQLQAFAVAGRGVDLDRLEEIGQDGTYSMALTGDPDGVVSVRFLGEPVFIGPADDFGGIPESSDLQRLLLILLIVVLLGVIWWLWLKSKRS